MHGPAARTTLIGRDLQVRTALDALTVGRGLLITGVPGVGKTALARRVVEELRQVTTVTSVRFTSAADPGGPGGFTGPPAGAAGCHVLVVEDTHLLDPGGLDHLADDCRNGRLRLVATGHRVTGIPGRLVRDGVLDHLRLAPLDRVDTGRLVRGHLGGPLTADIIHHVWRTSAGNPRYAIDVVESALAEGRLALVDGTWLLTGRPDPGSGILAQTEADLARLPSSEREVVDLVALGGAVPLETLLSAIDDPAVLDHLVREERLVMDIDEASGGTLVRSAHPRLGDLVARLVPPARRRALFTRMFPSHMLPDGPADHLALAAEWALSAAVQLSADDLLRAARAAAASGWLDTTDRLATAALAAFAPRVPGRIEALLLRSDALRTAGRTAEAMVAAEAARAEVDRVDLPEPCRREWSRLTTTARANLAQFGRGDTEFALRLIAAEAARLDDAGDPDGRARARLEADRSMRLAYGARFDEAEAVELPAATVADLPPDLRIEREVALIHARAFRGDLLDASDRAADLVEVARAHVDDAPWGPLQAQSALFSLLLWRGEPVAAASLVDAVDTDPDAPGFVDPAIRQLGWGRVAGARGDHGGAVTELEAALARFGAVDFSGWTALTRSWLASAKAAAGDAAGAARALAAARREPLRASGILLFDLWDHWWRTALALGSPDAPGIARMLVDVGRQRHLALVELWGWHATACCTPEPTDRDVIHQRIEQLAARVPGALAAARAEHALALVAGDDTVAAATFGRLAGMGHWMPVDHAPAAATLTTRQLEIARLAATGLPAATIAERLHISRRTVESHLANVYVRLGINNRSDLATVLTAATDPR